jgi:hypothetical protein
LFRTALASAALSTQTWRTLPSGWICAMEMLRKVSVRSTDIVPSGVLMTWTLAALLVSPWMPAARARFSAAVGWRSWPWASTATVRPADSCRPP